MLRHRLFFGALLIAALVGLFIADARVSASAALPRADGLIVTLIVAAIVVVGGIELTALLRGAGLAPRRAWPIAMCVALVLAPLAAHNRWLNLESAPATIDYQLTVGLLVAAFAGAFLFIGHRRRTERAAADLAATTFVVLYLGLFPAFLVRLRVESPDGSVWPLVYFVATAKACDIGAYFTGLAIGRTKLIPWLSPKKTYEGLTGGIGFSIGTAFLIAHFMRESLGPFVVADDGSLQVGPIVAFGAIMALLGQAGDLLESLIKRDAQAKDSAAAIPAFGGVLDLIDSLILSAPAACWMLLR